MTDESPDGSPAEELSRALKQIRKASGVSGVELARRSGYSQSTISRMERGELAVSMIAAARWAWYLRSSREELRNLVGLARAAEETRSGLVPIRVVLQHGAESVQRRIRLRERNVASQSVFHPSILPGHLQTEAFIRYVMSQGGPAEISGLVAERLQRQREASTRSITFVVTEGTVSQGAPAELMSEQCEHLARLAVAHQSWRVGVVPRALPAGEWPNITQNGFDIYDDEQVFIGTTAGNAIVRDGQTVAAHVDRFARLVSLARFGFEAAAVFNRIAGEYRAAGEALGRTNGPFVQ